MSRAYAVPTGNPPADVARLRRLIGETSGRFFSALFVSRGRNQPRRMRARLKRLPAHVLERDRWNSQMTVWDREKRDWRVVPLERLVHLRCGGIEWVTGV
jgi:hypothetical protein